MGCDIHTRAEIKRGPDHWEMVGEVFDYPYDAKHFYISEELVNTLDDGTLMHGIVGYYYMTVEGPPDPTDPLGLHKSRMQVLDPQKTENLSEEAITQIITYHGRQSEAYKKIRSFRDSVPREEWDYHKNVRPTELRYKAELRDGTSLEPEIRQEILQPVLDFRYEAGEGESNEDLRYMIHLELSEGDPPFKTDEPYMARDYTLFAALANVRNGYGFAGTDTGDPIMVISAPRGVPEDASPEWKKYVAEWGVDGHSHSWLTLHEIAKWSGWNQTAILRGVVSEEQYLELRETGERPTDYSSSVFGQNIHTVHYTEYEDWLENREVFVRNHGPDTPLPKHIVPFWAENELYNVHVKMQWEVTLRHEVHPAFWKAVDKLKELAHEPRNIRLMFFFDN